MQTGSRWFLAAVLISVIPFVTKGQLTNVRVSAPETKNPNEVTIVIDPTNPARLLAGSNLKYTYRSSDGGATWVQGELSEGSWGDPSLTFDASGWAYYAHLSNLDTPAVFIDRLMVHRSSDGGETWFDSVEVGLNPPKQQDKEWITADMTGSAFHDNLYMAWTEFDSYGSLSTLDSTRILFSRSTNSGYTWSPPMKISDVGGNCLDDDSTVEGAVPAVGPNGEVYIAWAGPLGIMFDKSTDGGVTFGIDRFVTSQPGGWAFSVPGIYRCNGLPQTACDISNSAYRGTVYVLWSDQRNGPDDTDIFLIKSTDGGDTWGSIKRVNDDPPGRHQFFAWMAVNPTSGYLYVVFYDRRETTGDTTDVYVARSIDGGATFENFKVSDASFVPDAGVFFGDYIGIDARGSEIHPIWTRMESGNRSIWTTVVGEITPSVGPSSSLIGSFALDQNYPNPFNPETHIRFVVPHRVHVTLSVFDLLGQEVERLVDGERNPGEYRAVWRGANASAGVYFCRIVAGDYRASRKMVLLK